MIRPMTRPARSTGRGDWPTWRGRDRPAREWLPPTTPSAGDVLDRLRGTGPLLSRDIPDTSAVPWPSTGWTNNRNVTQMLQFLDARGEVAIAGRSGRQRLWDLAERVYPDCRVLPAARRGGAATSAGSALGIAGVARLRSRCVGEAGEPAEVEGPGRAGGSTRPRSASRSPAATALLSPFDRLVHDRVRALDLFEFDYVAGDVQAEGASGAGATSRCRCCTATGSSARSTRPPTARPACSGSTRSTRTSRSRSARAPRCRTSWTRLAGWLGLTAAFARSEVDLPNGAGRAERVLTFGVTRSDDLACPVRVENSPV